MSDREIHITVEVNSKPTLINKDELNEIYKYIEESVNKIQGPFVNLSWKVDIVNKLKELMLREAYIKTSKTFEKESNKKVIDELINIMIEERKEEYQREKGDF